MNRHRLLLGLCLILLVLAATPPPTAAADCQDWVARTVSVQGRVETRRAGESQWLPVQIGAAHCLGDAVRLGTLSRAAIVLREGGVVRLDQNTTITFTPPPERAGTWLDVLTGAAHFFTRAPRRLRITTPFVNGSVEGTEFLVEVEVAEARISVWEGRVLAENAQGSARARGRAVGGGPRRAGSDAPADRREARRRRGLGSLLSPGPRPSPRRLPRPARRDAGRRWIRRSIEEAQAGGPRRRPRQRRGRSRPRSPTRGCSRTGPGSSSPWDEWTRPDPDIDRALALDPQRGDALALRSVVALATERPRRCALGWPSRRSRRDPASAAAAGRSPTPGRRPSTSTARPQSVEAGGPLRTRQCALAHARLAELWLAQGRLDRARVAEAEEARASSPDSAATQARARLHPPGPTRDGAQASEAFETVDRARSRGTLAAARPRPDTDPPRSTSRRAAPGLEIAVSLDPGDSLLRSYLGKAYYEERKPVLAADQFKLARELDPNDPTPWLYDAIRLQSVNRPVEALESLARSIELNDNRAVYRSPATCWTRTGPPAAPTWRGSTTTWASSSAPSSRAGCRSTPIPPATRRTGSWPTSTPSCRATTQPA